MMTPSEAGLQRFLKQHPLLNPDELQRLMYRAGYADGALDMLAKLEDAVKTKERKAVSDV